MPLGLLWKLVARKMALDRVVFYVFELILILRSHYLRGIDTYDFTLFIIQIKKKKKKPKLTLTDERVPHRGAV